MAGSLQSKDQAERLGLISLRDFILQLKELQICCGHAFTWKMDYVARRINIYVKGKQKRFKVVAHMGSSRMEAGHPDIISSIRYHSQTFPMNYMSLETFRKRFLYWVEHS